MRRVAQYRRDKRNTKSFYALWLDEQRETFYCPGCFRQFSKGEMERAHIYAWSEGGLSVPWNVLGVCSECHALYDRGNSDHAYAVRRRMAYTMFERFGLLVLLQTEWGRKVIQSCLIQKGLLPTWHSFRRLSRELRALGFLWVTEEMNKPN